jgi:ComF family protein
LSENLSDVLVSTDWEIDIVIPVPLGVARRKERGYNQASLLARPIALMFDYSYQPNILSRTRETISQTELNFKQRKENVAGAFDAPGGLVNGKNILIVDDVRTSGSTLNSCADALFRAGAKNVYGLTLASASQKPE